ncbi:hypothetical protein GOP47_0003388 [Adiantum capillus-veneris]|uniref:Uncharacterized protein n=1 Tax=Adiantum capillus-veneris TaxID=13818 RepID=A0A9D4VCQ6_ADICA|nr:hypothetical protein GOP47_0003388 [Adiantum capillus-veneris]
MVVMNSLYVHCLTCSLFVTPLHLKDPNNVPESLTRCPLHLASHLRSNLVSSHVIEFSLLPPSQPYQALTQASRVARCENFSSYGAEQSFDHILGMVASKSLYSVWCKKTNTMNQKVPCWLCTDPLCTTQSIRKARRDMPQLNPRPR